MLKNNTNMVLLSMLLAVSNLSAASRGALVSTDLQVALDEANGRAQIRQKFHQVVEAIINLLQGVQLDQSHPHAGLHDIRYKQAIRDMQEHFAPNRITPRMAQWILGSRILLEFTHEDQSNIQLLVYPGNDHSNLGWHLLYSHGLDGKLYIDYHTREVSLDSQNYGPILDQSSCSPTLRPLSNALVGILTFSASDLYGSGILQSGNSIDLAVDLDKPVLSRICCYRRRFRSGI